MTDSPDACAAYREDIAEIASTLGSLAILGEVFSFERFIAVFESPEVHVPCAVEVLSDAESLPLQRQIAVLSMQKAGRDGFGEIAGAVHSLHREERISTETLEMALIPPAEWARAAGRHYDEPRVADALAYLADLPETEAGKAGFIREFILTGEGAAALE